MKQISPLQLSFCLLVLAQCSPSSLGQHPVSELAPPAAPKESSSHYRGWDYIASKLKADGVPEEDIRKVYLDNRMPEFSFVPFKLKPQESSYLYSRFTRKDLLEVALGFLSTHSQSLKAAEKQFGVSPHIISALFLVETQCGRNTGQDLVVYRLSRVASVKDSSNIEQNHSYLEKNPTKSKTKSKTKIRREDVLERAKYLEDTFYPEVRALFEMWRSRNIDIFGLRGSSAGAFGIPQFLPSSFLRYGIDGNRDNVISLFSIEDAIYSAANYLSHFGWKESLSILEKKSVLWHYNRSEAYGEAVLKVAIQLKERKKNSYPKLRF